MKPHPFQYSIIIMLAIMLGNAHAKVADVSVTDDANNTIKLYGGSYALVIGVSDYQTVWPDLPGVASDTEAVSQALKKQGFTVKQVLNPDHKQLTAAYEDFIQQYGGEYENRLVFYFAGHGYTLKPKYGGDALGYIVPADSPSPKIDANAFKRTALSMQRIEEFALNIDAKHAMFVFDSCFSGSIFSLSRGLPEVISYKTSKPVRLFISSGSEDEKVPDKSIFRRQFVSALGGEGDLNKDNYITGTELAVFLQDSVTNYSKNSQHPQFGKIRNANLDKGDMVFLNHVVQPNTASTVAANTVIVNDSRNLPEALTNNRDLENKVNNWGMPKGIATDGETQAWDLIKNSQTKGNLSSFLSHFPDGKYATQVSKTLANDNEASRVLPACHSNVCSRRCGRVFKPARCYPPRKKAPPRNTSFDKYALKKPTYTAPYKRTSYARPMPGWKPIQPPKFVFKKNTYKPTYKPTKRWQTSSSYASKPSSYNNSYYRRKSNYSLNQYYNTGKSNYIRKNYGRSNYNNFSKGRLGNYGNYNKRKYGSYYGYRALDDTKAPLKEMEASVWKKMQGSSSISDYDTFLTNFPAGQFAFSAKYKLSQLVDDLWAQLDTKEGEIDNKITLLEDEAVKNASIASNNQQASDKPLSFADYQAQQKQEYENFAAGKQNEKIKVDESKTKALKEQLSHTAWLAGEINTLKQYISQYATVKEAKVSRGLPTSDDTIAEYMKDMNTELFLLKEFESELARYQSMLKKQGNQYSSYLLDINNNKKLSLVKTEITTKTRSLADTFLAAYNSEIVNKDETKMRGEESNPCTIFTGYGCTKTARDDQLKEVMDEDDKQFEPSDNSSTDENNGNSGEK